MEGQHDSSPLYGTPGLVIIVLLGPNEVLRLVRALSEAL